MAREITLRVVGDTVYASRKRAGVQGEGNVTRLVVAFDESWDGFAKKITWWDALDENPVVRTLTADLLVDLAHDTRTYATTIPAEPLALEGECTLVIDGYTDGRRARSLMVRMDVEPAMIADTAGEPIDPTPTQAEQLQVQIDTLLEDMSAEALRTETAADNAEAARNGAEAARAGAETAKNAAVAAQNKAETAQKNAETAETGAEAARKAAETARTGAETAKTGAETARKAIEDMTVSAETLEAGKDATVEKSTKDGVVHLELGIPQGPQGVSGVYVGSDEMPKGYNVKVDPNGDQVIDLVGDIIAEGDRQIARVAAEGGKQVLRAVESTGIIVKSSTEGSTKRFKITVDDSGTLTATEVP